MIIVRIAPLKNSPMDETLILYGVSEGFCLELAQREGEMSQT